jgi:hypothetical protein
MRIFHPHPLTSKFYSLLLALLITCSALVSSPSYALDPDAAPYVPVVDPESLQQLDSACQDSIKKAEQRVLSKISHRMDQSASQAIKPVIIQDSDIRSLVRSFTALGLTWYGAYQYTLISSIQSQVSMIAKSIDWKKVATGTSEQRLLTLANDFLQSELYKKLPSSVRTKLWSNLRTALDHEEANVKSIFESKYYAHESRIQLAEAEIKSTESGMKSYRATQAKIKNLNLDIARYEKSTDDLAKQALGHSKQKLHILETELSHDKILYDRYTQAQALKKTLVIELNESLETALARQPAIIENALANAVKVSTRSMVTKKVTAFSVAAGLLLWEMAALTAVQELFISTGETIYNKITSHPELLFLGLKNTQNRAEICNGYRFTEAKMIKAERALLTSIDQEFDRFDKRLLNRGILHQIRANPEKWLPIQNHSLPALTRSFQ